MIIAVPFYTQFVKLPDASYTPIEIRSNSKFFPFFEDCVGAIDGTHIHAFVTEEDLPRYRNRKGGISQNVLAACTFDMCFSYVLAGWEGSAADGRIFEDAQRRDLLIPSGKYLVADAGFSNCEKLLVPYRETRYHLKEWGRQSEKYFYRPSTWLSAYLRPHQAPDISRIVQSASFFTPKRS